MQHGQPNELTRFEFNKTYTGRTYQYVMTGVVMKNLYKYWGVLSPSKWAMTLTAATIQPAAEYTGSERVKALAGYTALGLSFVLNPISAGISFAAHTVSNEFLEAGWESMPEYIRRNWLGHEAFALAHVCKNEGISYGVRKYEDYKEAQEESKKQQQQQQQEQQRQQQQQNNSNNNNGPDKTNDPSTKHQGKHKHKSNHKHKHRSQKSNHAIRKDLEHKIKQTLHDIGKQKTNNTPKTKVSAPKPAPTQTPTPANNPAENKINDMLKKGYKVYKHEKRNGKGHTKGGHMDAAAAAEHLKAGGELEFKKPGSKIWMKKQDTPTAGAKPQAPANNSTDLKQQLKNNLKNHIHSRSQMPQTPNKIQPSAASMKVDELKKDGYRFYKKENGTIVGGHLNTDDVKAYLQAGGQIECKKVGETKICLTENIGNISTTTPPVNDPITRIDETALSAIKQTHAFFFGKKYKKKQIAPQPVVQPADDPLPEQNHAAPVNDQPPAAAADHHPAPEQPEPIIEEMEEPAEPAAPVHAELADPAQGNPAIQADAADNLVEEDNDQAELLIEEGEVCNSELTASSVSDNESCDEEANNNAFSSDEDDDEEKDALVSKIAALFEDLRSKIQHYQELSVRVQHGMFAGQHPSNIRAMNEVLDKIDSGAIAFKDGIKSIVAISKHNGVIHDAASKCFDFVNGNANRYTM